MSVAQMPGGVLVATFAIGKSGGQNAVLFAVRTPSGVASTGHL